MISQSSKENNIYIMTQYLISYKLKSHTKSDNINFNLNIFLGNSSYFKLHTTLSSPEQEPLVPIDHTEYESINHGPFNNNLFRNYKTQTGTRNQPLITTIQLQLIPIRWLSYCLQSYNNILIFEFRNPPHIFDFFCRCGRNGIVSQFTFLEVFLISQVVVIARGNSSLFLYSDRRRNRFVRNHF